MAADDLLGDELICAGAGVLDSRDPRSNAHRCDCSADPQPLRELKPWPARRHSGRRHGRRGADLRTDTMRERWRRRVVLGMPPDARAQRRQALERRLAGLASGEMLLDRHGAREIELPVKIGVHAAAALYAVHLMTPAGLAADVAAAACVRERAATSRYRAECRRSPRSPCTTSPPALSAR